MPRFPTLRDQQRNLTVSEYGMWNQSSGWQCRI